ncbi:tRNA preQ1(34) S-adenosylmethionine ribosyltransferase-isomerase QueA [soil metagenome]
MQTADFTYQLPPSAVAQRPAEPRDSSRLLVVPGLADRRFADLPDLLVPGDLLVVNDTRVRAARLQGRRATGGSAEALLLTPLADGVWSGLVRPARRLPEGAVIHFGDIVATVLTDPREGMTTLKLEGPADMEEAIEREGTVPLPPYIHGELDDPDRYQTVYASAIGSAAAPTAGLHFTPSLLDHLVSVGVGLARIELKVGIGTFRPITTQNVADHRMHPEWVSVPPATARAVADTRRAGGAVVAIGTTVVRALESRTSDGQVAPGWGETDLFITPGFRFQVVDRLVTNFHLPSSTLLCMVAAFVGDSWKGHYETALERGYRFLSFGDAMLADRAT